MNNDISEVQQKIKAVECALGTFADYNNEEERRHFLRQNFEEVPGLKIYFGFSEKQLQDEKKQLQDEKKQLQDEKKLLQDSLIKLQQKENLLLAQQVEKLKNEAAGDSGPKYDDVFECKPSQKCASTFAAGSNSSDSVFRGLGCASIHPFFDPTDVADHSRLFLGRTLFNAFRIEDSYVTDCLRAFDLDCTRIKKALASSVVAYNDMSKVSETKPGNPSYGKCLTVKLHHLDQLRRTMWKFLMISMEGDSDNKLQDFQCSFGLASEDSVPYGRIVDRAGQLRAVIEVKDTTASPQDGLRQAAAEATNVAMFHLSLGVAPEKVFVPVVGGSGHLIQFGAVTVLEPSLPVFTPTTKVLDLLDEDDLNTAATALGSILYYVIRSTLPTLPTGTPPKVIQSLALSPNKYHCKILKDFYCATGNLQTSLLKFYRTMRVLHRDINARDFVLFPLCVREFKDDVNKSSIVFPNLTEYRIGLPDDDILRASFLLALKVAVCAIHAADVVHLDLYLSNVMWKVVKNGEGPDSVKLKIIDWDSAQLVSEVMEQGTSARLSGLRRDVMEKYRSITGGISYTKDYDWSLVAVTEMFLDDVTLQVSDKPQLDEAFRCLLDKYLRM